MSEPQTLTQHPVAGEKLAEFPTVSKDEVKERIDRAHKLQPAWAALPARERARRLLCVRAALVERADDLAALIARDNGKTILDALATEVLPACMAISFYAKRVARVLRPRRLRGTNFFLVNKTSRLYQVPYGVVGIISPWNYPFSIPFSEIIMALLTGNAVLWKAASETQVVAKALEACLHTADLPEGLFTHVNLPGRLAGDAFLDGGVDKLFFTGSVGVGQSLMANAARRLVPLVLELGGCNPAIVCADADLERAAGGILWAGFSNAGQSCGAAQRIFVHRSVLPAFLETLRPKVEALRLGPGESPDSDVGRMTTQRQKDTVARQVQACLALGAKVFAQAPISPEQQTGVFFPPTVLIDVTHEMPVLREEIFGPVIGVMPFDDLDQAVRLANDTSMGLTASVWSRNHRAARHLATRIRAGAVTVNDALMSHGLAETPWGGFGLSGLGRTHSEIGLLEMVQPQVVVDDWLPGVKKNLWWHPYSARLYRGVHAVLEVLYGPGLWRRMRAVGPLLKNLARMFSARWDKE